MEIAKMLPDISPSTIELILGKMVKDGRIEKIGSTRNIRYINKQ